MKETMKRPLAKKPNNWHTLIWVLLAWLLFIYLFRGVFFPASPGRTISYTEFKQTVKQGRIEEVRLKGQEITGKFRQSQSAAEKSPPAGEKSIFQMFQKGKSRPEYFKTTRPALEDAELLSLLEKNNVVIYAETPQRSWWATLLITLLPWLLILGLIFYASKKMQQVEADDFEQARDKILLGLEREDVIKDEDKNVISCHEAGHALLAKLLPGADPLQKVTIIPRGRSLGATEQIPKEERHNIQRSYLLNCLAIMLGGRAAEKIVFEDVSTGAADDLKKATKLARSMVCQWGMSDKIGPVTFRLGETHPFLGRELTESRDFSEHTARLIDEEIQAIVGNMEKKAEKTLTDNRNSLNALTEQLLEHETLSKEEVDKILEKNSGTAN